MNKISTILRQWAFCLMMGVMLLPVAVGQTYQPGDLYVFQDGSKGIVFYVNPDDPGSGTVAALNDLEDQYALWTGSKPSALRNVFAPNGTLYLRNITNWENHGRRFTELLASSGVSPAAAAVDVAAGWYIPDALQLYKLYASAAALQESFAAHGGDILSLWTSEHWSATQEKTTNNYVYAMGNALRLYRSIGTNKRYVRPVRDFPDTASVTAFWADNPQSDEMVVAPDSTTPYDAFVVYRSDTLPLTATVTVIPFVSDTVRETVHASLAPYTSVVSPLFSGLNISKPGDYTYQDTLSSSRGCDSVLVLLLTVSPCVSDFSFTCPPDFHDTLAYGDCVMEVYPDRIGTPTIVNRGEWPITVSNDLPETLLFAEGDHIVTWTAVDSVCGGRDSCEQHVVVAFPQCPDAVDCEGNVYHAVRIGCDCWTQRNLESKKYSDCADIDGVYNYASWRFPDTAANVAVYGRLYGFGAAVRDSSDNGYGHIQGVCPQGWYLPTPEKYESLDAYGAAALKSPLYWFDGGGDNSTGFSALPAGFYNGEKNRYEGMLSETYFWSVSGVRTQAVKSSYLIAYWCDTVHKNERLDGLGYSVRCIKEKEVHFEQ